MNLGIAVVLLIGHGLYLLFMLATHLKFFSPAG